MSLRNYINKNTPSELRFGYVNLYVNTKEGLQVFDWLAEYEIVEKWHNLGVFLLFTSMLSSFLFLLTIAITTVTTQPESTPANNPKNVLAIPGVNEFIPVSQAGFFVIAILIAIVVHEGGHALAARKEDVQVNEWGLVLFLGLIPLGAYVEPDEEELETLPLLPYSRVLSAGVLNNFAVTALTTLYFFLPSTPDIVQMMFDQIAIAGGDGTFFTYSLLATALYWVWFININLAFVNTLPISLLDGGRVSNKTITVLFERWDFSRFKSIAKTSVSIVAFGLFLVVLFGPLLL